MTKNPRCVALVTARGGSKRVPGKNLRLLGGKPLIAWTIEAALSATTIDRVVLSTDDQSIADVARASGAEVPFMRPQSLSGDYSSHYEVVSHALDWLDGEGDLPELVCLLQPTSPMRLPVDIDELVSAVRRSGADCGVTVAPIPVHPALMVRIAQGGTAEPYLAPTEGYLRSQDMEPLHYINGAAYVFRPASFRARSKVLGPGPLASLMPAERSIDIDEERDFHLAEALFGLGSIEQVSKKGGSL